MAEKILPGVEFGEVDMELDSASAGTAAERSIARESPSSVPKGEEIWVAERISSCSPTGGPWAIEEPSARSCDD